MPAALIHSFIWEQLKAKRSNKKQMKCSIKRKKAVSSFETALVLQTKRVNYNV